MKNYLYPNLILIGLSAILCFSVAAQNKKPPAKTVDAPIPPLQIELSKMELAVVDQLNEARTNPAVFIAYLEERRRALQGNVIKMPRQPPVRTIEGAAAIDEAVESLRGVADLKSFQVAAGLNQAARAQLADLQEDSSIGHFGKDGSDLKTRLARFGSTKGKCGENICYRGRTARDVAAIFLVDDGVKSRAHREAVLSKHFKQIGVACGTGKNAESLCVVTFADNFKEKTSAPDAVEF